MITHTANPRRVLLVILLPMLLVACFSGVSEDPTSTRTVTCETLQSLANDLSFSTGLCMLTFDSTYEDCECRTSNGNLISSSGGEAGGLSVNGDSDGGDADGLVGSGGSYYGLVVESSSLVKLTGMLLIIQFTVVLLG